MGTIAASFLPKIKCSNCGAGIEISAMGDHVCSHGNDPQQPSSSLANASRETDPVKARRMPPRIDPMAANQQFVKMDKPALTKEQSKSRNKSPAPQNGPKSPFRLPSRNREIPNPAVDLPLSQDCAFPTFPTSRSETPTTPQEPKHPLGDSRRASPKSTHTAPTGTLGQRGEDVIGRMNKIAPGPFDIGAQRKGVEQPIHNKAGTTGSSRAAPNRQDGTQVQGVPERHSTSSGSQSHSLTSNDVAQSNRFTGSRNGSHPPIATSEERMLRSGSALGQTRPIMGSERQLLRSQTFAVDDRSRPAEAQGKHTRQQSSSTPAVSHVRKPSVAAANRPLDEIGSMSTYKPFRFATADTAPLPTAPTPDANKAERSDSRVVNAPPVPPPIQTMGFHHRNFSHSPTESRSSNASSASSAHTTRSSRSSPPLSEVGYSSRRKGSDTSRIDTLMEDLQATMAKETSLKAQAPPQAARPILPRSFSRPLYPRSPEMVSKPGPFPEDTPEPPVDTSMQFGRLSPLPLSPRRTPSPSKMTRSAASARKPSFPESSAPRFPPTQQQPLISVSPVRRPITANKGNCRGCGKLIKGKSVSSADGRLTGRYHKDCFVCKTCNEPFQTADFYIMDNNPYCSRHYHQLNGSLCKSCDRGIEGQYLEAETKSKFHPACFTCRDCRKILANEYFEFNGTVLCEEHARRAAQASLLLNPGRKHPEKRTTRLMVM